MNERFTILDSINSITYNEELPILVKGANLLHDSLNGRIYAQIKLQSIFPRQITAIEVEVETFDAQNRSIETCRHVYENLQLYRDNTVGEDVLIPLEDNRGRRLGVNVCSIMDSSGQETRASGKTHKSCAPQGSLLDYFDGDNEMVKQYKLVYGKAHTHAPYKLQGLWMCSCSAINSSEEDVCHQCGYYRDDILCPDIPQLREDAERRLLDEKAEKDKRRAGTIKASVLIGTLIVTIIIVVVVSVKIIVPEMKYRDALKVYESGDYSAAYASFSSLSNYKKSRNYADSSKKAYCEDAYKEILSGNNTSEMEEYYSADEIKSKDTQFSLAYIDDDDIPELIIMKDRDLFIYTISEDGYLMDEYFQGPFLEGPWMTSSYTGFDEYGYFEEGSYIYSFYGTDDEDSENWKPLRQDKYQDSYTVTTTYNQFFYDDVDYVITDSDDEERYVNEDEFYQELELATDNKEYTQFKTHDNNEENREKYIVL